MAKLCDRIISAIDKEEIKLEEQREKFKVVCINDYVLNSSNPKPKKKRSEDMKNLTKRKDGSWCGRKLIRGVSYCVYARTQKECKEKLREALACQPKKKEKKTNKIKLIDFAEKWFITYKKNSLTKESVRNYSSVLKNHIAKLDKNIQDITQNELQQFINETPATRIKEYVVMILKQIFKKAKELKLIKDNPCEFITKGKIEKRKKEWFNLQEQKLILDNLPKTKTGFVVKALLLTGARPSELNGITKSDIKGEFIHIKGTKTENAVRWVKISEQFRNELLSQPNDVIFDYYLNRVQKNFKDFVKRLGIDGSLYTLRHTFASNLFYLGVPDKIRQSFMGHASIVMTNDVYTSYDPTITKQDIINLYKDLYPKF